MPGLSCGERPAVNLSFLYRAFFRILPVIRLVGRSDTDLAIEVVLMGHGVAAFRRQVHRPTLEPADPAVLEGLARLLPRMDLPARPAQSPRHREAEPPRSSSDTRRRIRSEATAAPRASSPP